MTFGENLRKVRKSKGLTQGKLGELTNMSGSAVGQFEASAKTPKKETVVKFAEALGVNPAELDNDLVVNLGNDFLYQMPDGKFVSMPMETLEGEALSLLNVLTEPAAKQWIALGKALAGFSENRKDHGKGLEEG